MAETMADNLPMILMILGGVLILAMLFLLLRMQREKNRPKREEESSPPVSRTTKKSTQRSTGTKTLKKDSVKQKSKPTESEKRATVSKTLPVLDQPVKKMPGIQRRHFEEFKGKRILVAEDNAINRKLILTLLDGLGLELETAENGRETLNRLFHEGKGRIDLILMDINMPILDGLEAAREIREHPIYDRMPIVALSASTNDEEVRQILESGMNAYLEKPIDLGKLYRVFKLFFDWQNAQPDYTNRKSPVGGLHAQVDKKVLDWEKGVRYSNGDEELYAGILKEFFDQYSHSDRQLKEWIDAKDYEAIKALAVDLEGISATIGAKPFYNTVTRLHKVAEQKVYTMLPNFIDEYKKELRDLMREVEKYLEV